MSSVPLLNSDQARASVLPKAPSDGGRCTGNISVAGSKQHQPQRSRPDEPYVMDVYTKGKGRLQEAPATEPETQWKTLAALRHTDEDDEVLGGSPRSVQTALSYAESIGYSTEFVLPPDQPAAAEAQRQRQFHPVPDGIILASVVCLGIVVLLFAACASYFILTVVA